MTHQPTFVEDERDTYCSYSHKLIKEDFEDKKDSEIMKTPNTSANHNSSVGGQSS